MTFWFRCRQQQDVRRLSGNQSRRLFCWLAICTWAAWPQANLSAQTLILKTATGELPSGVVADKDSSTETGPQSKRQEVAEELRVAQRTLDTAKETSDQTNTQPPEALQREVELLKQLDVAVAQQEVAKAEAKDLQTRIDDLQKQLESIRQSGPPEKPPYSFLLLDHLRDELTSRQSRTETMAAALAAAGESVVVAKQTLEAKEQAHRLAKEFETSNTDEAKKAELAKATKIAELEARIAAENHAVKKLEHENEILSQKLHQTQVDLLQEKVNWISKAAVFSEADLQEQMIEIDKQEQDLRSELLLAESNKQYAESEWSRARQQLDSSMDKKPEFKERVAATQAARQLYQTQVAVINNRLQRRSANRELWQRRFKVVGERAETSELITWAQDARERLSALERERRLEQIRIDEVRQDLVGLEKQLQSTSEENVRIWIEQHRTTLNQLIQTHDANILSIETSRRLAEKLLGEIEGDVSQWTVSEWFDSARHYLAKVWNMEITKVDDHPLTVGKVLVGVILVFVGFILARMLSRTLGFRLQHGRIAMNESGASALQSLSFYVLLVTFTLMSLKFVNVPLTMFTFLGGAIAIGVGFGSQNVLNNFISGLILLAERPIKVGDLIQVDTLYGNVEQIGARSTVIRTGDNLDIIVPNSTFLENNVVNLTRGDDKLRTKVCVGIAYGSPTREATTLMKNAAVEHGRILKRPEPFVWFTDFGDNALHFEVHFWVKVRSLADRTRIESDLRYRIDNLFHEAGITIAFPQRDVHFDTSEPIPIRVVANDEYSFDNPPTSGAA